MESVSVTVAVSATCSVPFSADMATALTCIAAFTASRSARVRIVAEPSSAKE